MSIRGRTPEETRTKETRGRAVTSRLCRTTRKSAETRRGGASENVRRRRRFRVEARSSVTPVYVHSSSSHHHSGRLVASPAFAPCSSRLLPSFVGFRGRRSWVARVRVPTTRRAERVRRRARASRNCRATYDAWLRVCLFPFELVHHARGHRGASLARASVFHGHAREGLLDVHASPSPGGFLAGRTGGPVAHTRAGGHVMPPVSVCVTFGQNFETGRFHEW